MMHKYKTCDSTGPQYLNPDPEQQPMKKTKPRKKKIEKSVTEEDREVLQESRLNRTKRMIEAAYRVWELRRGLK